MKFAERYKLNCQAFFLLAMCCHISLATAQDLDVQGHRGCRGLMPENTIPAFLKAAALGVTTIELDVVISRDRQVVVSHDLFLSHLICLAPDGSPIREDEEKNYSLYQMDYADIRQCDCGSQQHPGFPEQANFPVAKPLLTVAIDSVEQFLKSHQLPLIQYNIETKSSEEGDNIWHPEPPAFVDLLVQVLKEKQVLERTTIQSFDVRTLQYARKKYPDIKLALLVGDQEAPVDHVKKLGFTPEIYSPQFKLVNDDLLAYAKEEGMKVIPWTVNDPQDIHLMILKKVDGMISDYPDRVLEILDKN